MKTLDYNAQLEADFIKQLRIFLLKKEGYLDHSVSGIIRWGEEDRTSAIRLESHMDEYHPFLRLLYAQTSEEVNKQSFDYKIFLHKTPCNYGGYRYWFMCPLPRSGMTCGRLSAVLYKAGNYFGCRHCYNLTYQCRKHNTNYSLNSWIRSRKIMSKIEKLEQEVKRSEYRGKPTLKQRKLDQAYSQIEGEARKFSKSHILSVCN